MAGIASYNPLTSEQPRICCINTQRLGQALHRISLVFYQPLHFSSHAARFVVMPLGQAGGLAYQNARHKTAEIAKRIVSITLVAALSPLVVASALVGGTFQLMGNAVAPHPYTYIRGKESLPDYENRQKKLMTYNTCMFWGSLPMFFGGVFPWKRRIEDIAWYIEVRNPTVVAAQEVCYEAGLTLAKKLKHQYSHIFLNIGPYPLRMESCLFVALRGDLVAKPYFRDFQQQKGVRRGFMWIETQSFVVVATHLSSGSNEQARSFRKSQFALITQAVQTHFRTSKKTCILLGDLNCTSDEIPEQFVNHYANQFGTKVDATTATCTNALTPWMRGGPPPREDAAWEIDDYILLSSPNGENTPSTHIERIESFKSRGLQHALSDHHAVMLTLS